MQGENNKIFLCITALVLFSCGSNGPMASPKARENKVQERVSDADAKSMAKIFVSSNEQQTKVKTQDNISTSYCSVCTDIPSMDDGFPWPSKIINRNYTNRMIIENCTGNNFEEDISEFFLSKRIGEIRIYEKSAKCLLRVKDVISLNHVIIKIRESYFKDTVSILEQIPFDIDGLEFSLSDFDMGNDDYLKLQKVLSRFVGLKYLKVDSRSWAIVSSIQHLSTLEELELSACSYFNKDSDNVSFQDVSSLFFRNIQRLTTTGHPDFVSRFENLRMLRTGGNVKLSDLKNTNKLEYLIFTGGDPVKELCMQSWPHLKSLIMGNHTISVEEQKRFQSIHRNAMIVFSAQDIIENIFEKANSILMVHSITKNEKLFSTKEEIQHFLAGFSLADNYPHVRYSNSQGGVGSIRCAGFINVSVVTSVGQREIFNMGGCGNIIKWKDHQELKFSGTRGTELCNWLVGLKMWDSRCDS